MYLYVYIKCISDTYLEIYVNAYYSKRGKSTRLREKKNRYLGCWYIIIDCVTNEGRNAWGSDLWLRC